MINYKQIKLNRYFNITLSKDDIQLKKCVEGDIPLVSSGKYNNGVVGYIKNNSNYTLYKKNTITIDMFGKAFYQDRDYLSVSHGRVNILEPYFKLNKSIGLFLTTIFDANFKKYSFNSMCNKTNLNKEFIKLPADKNDEPDWEYMENYVKNIKSKVKDNFVNLNLIKNSNNYQKIDLSSWKEFNLNELFDIIGSKTTKKKILEISGEGNYPYITTQSTNNGTAGYYNIFTEYGNCLTIDSAVLGTCFYQEKDFSASDHIEILRPKFELNKFIALFFVTVINKIGKLLNYQYILKRNQTVLRDEKLFLPVDSYGNPDWQYMENYIKKISNDLL